MGEQLAHGYIAVVAAIHNRIEGAGLPNHAAGGGILVKPVAAHSANVKSADESVVNDVYGHWSRGYRARNAGIVLALRVR